MFFFFNATATTEIYTLSLHDALPIWLLRVRLRPSQRAEAGARDQDRKCRCRRQRLGADRKSTRLNSSHANISYAVFCLKKKKTPEDIPPPTECMHRRAPTATAADTAR